MITTPKQLDPADMLKFHILFLEEKNNLTDNERLAFSVYLSHLNNPIITITPKNIFTTTTPNIPPLKRFSGRMCKIQDKNDFSCFVTKKPMVVGDKAIIRVDSMFGEIDVILLNPETSVDLRDQYLVDLINKVAWPYNEK